jgi:hypothetical protein
MHLFLLALTACLYVDSLNNKPSLTSLSGIKSKFEASLHPGKSISNGKNANSCRRSTLFKSNPEMRKIIKSYLNNKIFGENVSSGKVLRNKELITELLAQFIPPVPQQTVDEEIKEIISKFDGKSFIEEHEFSSRIMLDNSIWEAAGETVVKEIAYLDSLNQMECGTTYLSAPSLEKLTVYFVY